jgi:hypothetical protein
MDDANNTSLELLALRVIEDPRVRLQAAAEVWAEQEAFLSALEMVASL